MGGVKTGSQFLSPSLGPVSPATHPPTFLPTSNPEGPATNLQLRAAAFSWPFYVICHIPNRTIQGKCSSLPILINMVHSTSQQPPTCWFQSCSATFLIFHTGRLVPFVIQVKHISFVQAWLVPGPNKQDPFLPAPRVSHPRV